YTHLKADFYCPECGKIVKGKNINNVYQRRRVQCPYCGDGISYPERYIHALLTQMQIPFVRQYTVKFQENGRKTHYKYDFYDQERNIFIETHGAQHFVPHVFERVGRASLEKIQQRDHEKRRMAVEQLGIGYIDLDCRKSDPDWMKAEVMKKLSFYPLETVDWKRVQREANSSITLQLITLCQQGYTQKQAGEIVHLHQGTVCQKLQQAKEDGLFDGITPRLLRTEENKRRKEEKKDRFAEELERREEQKRKIEERRIEKKKAGQILKHNELVEAIRGKGMDFAVLDDYVSTRTRLRFLCGKCGQEFLRTPTTILKDMACPYCKKLEEIRQRAREKYGESYEILGPYKDIRTPIAIHHRTCGTTYYKLPPDLFKTGCPTCGKKERSLHTSQTRIRKGLEKFKALLPLIEARGYTFVGEECRGLGKTNAFLCSHCGEIWMTTANHIISGRDHICTSPCKKKTQEEFLKQVEDLVGGEYSVLTEYTNAFTPVKIRHNLCGHEYMVAPAHFTSTGRRCPVCSRKK
ncbi:MAG: hypothetical protein ACOX85_10715, partial [Candidatus Pararuminococcus gallinarum]